jgi:hypothetical protein
MRLVLRMRVTATVLILIAINCPGWWLRSPPWTDAHQRKFHHHFYHNIDEYYTVEMNNVKHPESKLKKSRAPKIQELCPVFGCLIQEPG